MAELDVKNMYGNGIIKEIEESAFDLVLQNLQQDQYQYPEKSFIREIASNCVDAIEERKTAIKILVDGDPVSKYYSESSDKVTKDSEFDPNYYNLDYLSNDNEVLILYTNTHKRRDRIEVIDHGVGLGGKRLQGFFKLSYSTKRLNKKALGKWGIGAKSGLSTGVESFTVDSWHNGRHFQFEVYSSTFYSTIGKFDSVGKPNPREVWQVKKYNDAGEIVEVDLDVYYEVTTEPNGTKIGLDVKNPVRKKNTFIEAIKSQLTYFKQVKFVEVTAGSDEKTFHDIQDPILFENDVIIVPKTSYYNVPHLVLNRVNYGPIDFGEMEMDHRTGNIGIIGDPSDIDVNQSRESVRYTDKTRKALIGYMESAIDLAQEAIDKELKVAEDDLMLWLKSCKSIKVSEANSNSITARLAGLADMSRVRLTFKYKGKSKFIYHSKSFKEVFEGFRLNKVRVSLEGDHFKTETIRVSSWSQFPAEHLILMAGEDNMSAIKAGYIAGEIFNGAEEIYTLATDVAYWNEKGGPMLGASMRFMYEVLGNSSNIYSWDRFTPTEAFMQSYRDGQKKADEAESKRKEEEDLSAEEIRKRDGKFLYYNFRSDMSVQNNKLHFNGDKVVKTKQSLKINQVPATFSRKNTIYCTGKEINLARALLNMVPYDDLSDIDLYEKTYHDRFYTLGDSDHMRVIMVSNNNVKYINNYAVHVKEALQQIENKKIILMDPIKKYNTARLFSDKIGTSDFAFLRDFDNIDPDAFYAYIRLKNYIERTGHNFIHRPNFPETNAISEYFDKLVDFQTSIAKSDGSSESVKHISSRVFDTPDLLGADAVDMIIYCIFVALDEYANPFRPLLRGNTSFTYTDEQRHELYHAVNSFAVSNKLPKFNDILAEVCDDYHIDFASVLPPDDEDGSEADKEDKEED